MKTRKTTARPKVAHHRLVSECSLCGKPSVACIVEAKICSRCAIETLPRLAATYAATTTETLGDSNLETARMNEFFEGFGRRFWHALATFKAHRAASR